MAQRGALPVACGLFEAEVSLDSWNGGSYADDCGDALVLESLHGVTPYTNENPPSSLSDPILRYINHAPSSRPPQILASPFSSSDTLCINESQHNCLQHFNGSEACASTPGLTVSNCGGRPLPFMEWVNWDIVVQSSDSATVKPQDPDGGASSGHGSGFESNNLKSGDDRAGSCLSSTWNHENSTTPAVMNLRKWSTSVESIMHPKQRQYICTFFGQHDASGRICKGLFAQPEQLRRHVNTVHGTERPHTCKVLHCEKAFSRGDHLRDHYWTHLLRGGRAGKNQKMSLEELVAILGPKEGHKLKQKFNREKDKKAKNERILRRTVWPPGRRDHRFIS